MPVCTGARLPVRLRGRRRLWPVRLFVPEPAQEPAESEAEVPAEDALVRRACVCPEPELAREAVLLEPEADEGRRVGGLLLEVVVLFGWAWRA